MVIIAVNNQRDILGDTKANKRTMAVRLGPNMHRWYIACLHLAATTCIAASVHFSWPTWLALGGGALHTTYVFRHEGRALNRTGHGCLTRTWLCTGTGRMVVWQQLNGSPSIFPSVLKHHSIPQKE